MSHESVWYSRPRNYGKGSREWYVISEEKTHRLEVRERYWNIRTNTR